MTFPAKNLGFILRGVFCGLATPDVKSPLVFIYLASIPWGGLKIPSHNMQELESFPSCLGRAAS